MVHPDLKQHLVPGEDIGGAVDENAQRLRKQWEVGELRIVTETSRWPVKIVPSMFGSSEDYQLSPEYQRRRRWEVKRRAKLIESLILNIPIPPVFLYEVDPGRYEVMDGLQRLTTILDYYADKFALTNLEILHDINDKKYTQLPPEVRRQLDRSLLSAIVILEESIKDRDQQLMMKQLVFQRINSGGVQLSSQEARNALMPGKMNDLCLALSTHPSFQKCWGFPRLEDISDYDDPDDTDNEPDEHMDSAQLRARETIRRMEDVEYVLRFFAMRQRANFQDLPLRDYLDLFMRRGNDLDEKVLNGLAEQFKGTFDLLYEILGENAFRRWTGAKWGSRRSTLVYDAVSQGFSLMLANRDVLLKHATEIAALMKKMYVDNKSKFNASYAVYIYHQQRLKWVVDVLLNFSSK